MAASSSPLMKAMQRRLSKPATRTVPGSPGPGPTNPHGTSGSERGNVIRYPQPYPNGSNPPMNSINYRPPQQGTPRYYS